MAFWKSRPIQDGGKNGKSVSSLALSNSFLGARSKEQERYHFDELADLIIYSHEVGIKKPDRRIFALACQRLGVRPEEMVLLDDFEPNVAAAQEFSIQAILFRETSQAIAELRAWLQSAAVE